MKIGLCCDHRGYKLKKQIIDRLVQMDIKCDDFGCFSEERCDYPIFAFKLGEAITRKECNYGVAICGSGNGMTISANKVKGIRCALVRTCDDVALVKEHNNVNVIAIGSGHTKVDEAIEMILTLINTPFLYDRYQTRIEMIEEYENKK